MKGSPSRRFHELGISEAPTDTRVTLRRAVVLGGSMAGLLAARVLSDHAEEVLIIERDDPTTMDSPRAGVPQGTQVHVLLDGGRVQLDRWFPGFSNDLVTRGAILSAGSAIQMYVNGVCKIPVPSDEILSASRLFLESRVRCLSLSRENVHLVRGQAQGLVFVGDRIVGVRYNPVDDLNMADIRCNIETADLVVDAMGRSSRLGDWLEQAGWPKPETRRMGIDLNYATASFDRGNGIQGVSTAQAITIPGDGRKAGVSALTAIEGNRWTMLLAGFAGDRPTRDPEDFLSRIRRDLPPLFGAVAEQCEMTAPIVTYRQADSRRRDFHRLDRLPVGLVAVGDAVASFNPIYGQGMSSAALHASCLSAYLRAAKSPHKPAWDYFNRVRVVVDAAWQTSTLNDLALPHVTGPYPRGYRIAHRLSGLILNASVADIEINRRFLQVTHMRTHPASLLRPGTLLRAARAVRTQTSAGSTPK